jgi:uncharacterized membrane protein YuzA (DUF378 family)
MVTNENRKGADSVGNWVLLVLDLIFVASIVFGVWQIYVPAAYIIGGIAGIIITMRMPGFFADSQPKRPVRR